MNMKDLPNEPVMKDLIQTITTFNVQFLKPKDDRLPGRIVYKKSFALNFEIERNELVD